MCFVIIFMKVTSKVKQTTGKKDVVHKIYVKLDIIILYFYLAIVNFTVDRNKSVHLQTSLNTYNAYF